MCGRFILTSPGKVIRELFGLDEAPELSPRYNIAPTDDVAIIRQPPGLPGREMAIVRWGLIPFWADDPKFGARAINARSESAADKPAFRDAFRERRCLVPADGFFEWTTVEGKKQPHLIQLADRQPFAMAGLWARWRGRDGERIESCTILTTDPNELVRPLHNRMPAILRAESWETWLAPHFGERRALEALLRPFPAEGMLATAVNPRVNKVANDDPSCIEPVG